MSHRKENIEVNSASLVQGFILSLGDFTWERIYKAPVKKMPKRLIFLFLQENASCSETYKNRVLEAHLMRTHMFSQRTKINIDIFYLEYELIMLIMLMLRSIRD